MSTRDFIFCRGIGGGKKGQNIDLGGSEEGGSKRSKVLAEVGQFLKLGRGELGESFPSANIIS